MTTLLQFQIKLDVYEAIKDGYGWILILVIILSIVAYVVKKYYENYLKRYLENHKYINEADLKVTQSNIDKKLHLYQLQTSKLHENRLNGIKDIYLLLTDLERDNKKIISFINNDIDYGEDCTSDDMYSMDFLINILDKQAEELKKQWRMEQLWFNEKIEQNMNKIFDTIDEIVKGGKRYKMIENQVIPSFEKEIIKDGHVVGLESTSESIVYTKIEENLLNMLIKDNFEVIQNTNKQLKTEFQSLLGVINIEK